MLFISSELDSVFVYFCSHQTRCDRMRQKTFDDFFYIFLYEIFVVVVVKLEKNVYLARIDASKSSSHEETYQIRLSIASNSTTTDTLAHNVKS